jgi:hypothetical protein
MKRIKLTRDKYALVDDADYEWLSSHKWYALKHGKTYYARHSKRINGKKTFFSMHRTILGLFDPKIKVDHKDYDGLNNQRNNLRVATELQNHHNIPKLPNCSSKYKGVSWSKNARKWEARIRIPDIRKRENLGYFINEIEAAKAYNEKALIYFGEFAVLNRLP